MKLKRGATGQQYAILIGLIAVLALAATAQLGQSGNLLLTKTANAIGGSAGTVAPPSGGGGGGPVTPDGFSFNTGTNADPGATYDSNAVTLSAFSGSLTATCGSGCTAISRNGGSFQPSPVSGFVGGDSIAIRQVAALTGGTVSTAVVTVGTTTSTPWSLITRVGCGAASQIYISSGSVSTMTVPSGCSLVTIKAWGGGGGGGSGSAVGGGGGFAKASFTINAGTSLTYSVGGASGLDVVGGYGGGGGPGGGGTGGGGGRSFVALTSALSNPLVIAGGGGGGGNQASTPGGGGGSDATGPAGGHAGQSNGTGGTGGTFSGSATYNCNGSNGGSWGGGVAGNGGDGSIGTTVGGGYGGTPSAAGSSTGSSGKGGGHGGGYGGGGGGSTGNGMPSISSYGSSGTGPGGGAYANNPTNNNGGGGGSAGGGAGGSQGGGGGGGYGGGGSGGRDDPPSWVVGGGGGGSSYTNTGIGNYVGGTAAIINASGQTAANSADVDYSGTAGKGGNASGSGSAGRIVFSFQ